MELRTCILLGLLIGTLAGPIVDDNQCSRRCTESTKFKYEIGTTYEFDYGVITRTAIAGASEEHSSLEITAKAHIDVLSKCDFSLSLLDVRIKRSVPSSPSDMEDADPTKEFGSNLEANRLRFSFQDGVIDQLCPESSESKWSLNIKRGVLTMFQNSMTDVTQDERVYEHDVTGSCDTDYKITQKGWYSVNIKKSKNLLSCSERNGVRTSVQGSLYRVPQSIQSLPLLKSIHDCDQEITIKGILKKSRCHEIHVFRPFSKDNNGAVTENNQRLELIRTSKRQSRTRGSVSKRVSLRFEHSHYSVGEYQSLREIKSKLFEICEATFFDVRPEVPMLFSNLVYIMKGMKSLSLMNVYDEIHNGHLCLKNKERMRKFYLDALPMVGTTDSVGAIVKLIRQGHIAADQIDMMLSSFAFISKPSKGMLSEAISILSMEGEIYMKKALLPISSMVNNYCEIDSDCLNDHEVISLVSVLETLIGVCDSSEEGKSKDLIILALRAVGNVGRSEHLVDSLVSCIQSKGQTDEVRISALQGYRSVPCSIDRSNVINVFMDSEEDSDIRINAYLVMMECPNAVILNQVQKKLEEEESNQVGSFVWSHLTNLMETSSPYKQFIRHILEDNNLKRELDMDKRKFSRNYEGSFFFDKYNTGAMIESNVIWSPKSFVPRSVNLNLTVDLFGTSINLLELGGRIEGLEYLLESYLGAEGIFRPPGKPRHYHETHGIRMDKLEKSKQKFADSKDELKGSVYLRLLSNELKYSRFNGMRDLTDSRGRFNFLKFLMKYSKEQDWTFTENIMFIDSSLIIPTGAGIPLNLTVNGTASVIIKASGRADFRKLAASPRSLHIHGSLLPSAAVEVSSSMMIDAFVTRTGLKMTSIFHTSTAVTGSLDLTRGEIFSLEIDTPKQKMDIFNLKSKFVIVHDKVEREQNMIEENRIRKKVCSSIRLKTITGLQICGEASFANASMISNAPYFPLTGPASFAVTIEKADIPNGFKIVGKTIRSMEAITAQFALDTLGSTTDRAISVDFVLNNRDKKLVAGLTSPWKKMAVKGTMLNIADKKSAKIILVNDEEDVYSMETFVNITRRGSTIKYTPLFEIKRPRARTITMKGTITSHKNDEIDGEIKLKGISDSDVDIKGRYVNSKEEKSASATLVLSPKDVYSFVSKVMLNRKKNIVKVLPTLTIKTPNGQLASFTGSADYRMGKFLKTDVLLQMESILKRPIRFKGNLMKTGINKNGNKGFGFRATCSLNCQLIVFKVNSNAGIRHTKKGKTVSSRLAVDYTLSNKKKNRLSFSSKLTDRSTKSLFKYTGNANLDVKKNPEYNTNLDIDINHNDRHSEVDFKVRHGENVKVKEDKSREFYLSATVNHKIKMPVANLDFIVKTVYPPKAIDYNINGQHSHNLRSLDSSFTVKYSPDKAVNVSLSLKNESKRHIKLAAAFALDYPGREVRISSDVTQIKRVDFVHYINIQLNKNERNRITSTYRNPTSTFHEVTSKIELNNQKPVKFDGAVNLNTKKFNVETKIERDGQRYGVDLRSYLNNRQPSGRWSIDLTCPHRRVTVIVEGGKVRNKYTGKFDTSWDVDRDAEKRLVTTLSFNVNKMAQNIIVGGSIDIASPFYPLRRISISADYMNDRSKFKTASKLQWDSKVISTDILIAKPVTKDNFNFSFIATSPFVGYRSIYCNVDHTLKNTNLASSLRANWEQYYIDIEAFGRLFHTKLRRDFTLSSNIKTNFEKFKTWSIDLEHADDWHNFKTKAKYRINGREYQFDEKMTFSKVGWLIRTDGEININSPDCRAIMNWDYSSSLDNIKTAMTTEWGYDGHKIHIEFHSTHDVTIRRKIDTELVIQSPWDPVKDIKVSVLHDFGENYAKRNIYFKQDQQVKASLVYYYKRDNNNVDLDFFHSNPYMDSISGNVNTQMNDNINKAYIDVTWAPNKKIILDGSLTLESKQYCDGQVRLNTPFEGFNITVAKFQHKKNHGVYITMAEVEYGDNKKIEFESQLGFEDFKKLKLTVKTPYPEISLFESGVYYNGNDKVFNSSANIKIMPKLENMGIQLSWNTNEDFTGQFKIVSPIEKAELFDIVISSKTTGKKRRSKIEMAYRRKNNTIVFDSMCHLKSLADFSVGIKLDTPYKQFPNMEADISFLYCKRNLESTFKLKTPFKRFKDMNFEVKHGHNDHQAESYVLIKLSPEQEYSADGKFRWQEEITGDIKVKTPHLGYETITGNFNIDAKTPKLSTHAAILFLNKKINTDLYLSFADDIEGRFSFVSPFTNFINVQAQFYKDANWKNFTAKGIIHFGRDHKIVNSSLSYSRKSDIFRLNFDLKTPYMKDMKLSILHDGVIEKFNTEVLAFQDDKYNLSSTTDFDREKGRINSDVNIGYIFSGKGNTLYLQFRADSESNEKATIGVSGLFNEKSINLTTSFHREMNLISGDINIITPFEGYSSLGLTFDHRGKNWKSFKSKGTMKSREDMVYIGKVEFSAPDIEHAYAIIEVYFPQENEGEIRHQLNKLHYAHNLNNNHFDIATEIMYNQDNKLSGAIEVTLKPKIGFFVRLDTPFEGYRTFQGSGSYSNFVEIHEICGQFMFERDSFMKLNSTIDLNSVPVDVFLSVETPYSGFEKVILRGNHQGDYTQFKTSVSFDSSNTSLVTSSIEFIYSSPNEMEGLVTLRSSFQNFSDIKLSLRQSLQNGYRKKRVEFRWAPGKEILLDGSYKWHQNWRGIDASGEVMLKTPFMILEDFKAKVLHNHAIDLVEIVDEAWAEYNGMDYLDVFSRYSSKKGGPHVYSIDIKEPRPMILSLSGKLHKDDMYVECFVNWNKSNEDSNVRLVTTFKTKPSELERSCKLKLVHPARTLGFEGMFKNTGKSYRNRAMITWDEEKGNTFSYDIEMNNRTERFSNGYTGSFKLGVPMRSVQISCGYSNIRGSKTYETSFFWDADKDLLKRFTAKAVLETETPMKRLDLSLKLPSVDKNYQLSSEMSRGIGSILFYGKSVFSYHKNPNRNLILLVKFEDIGMIRQETNYSLLVSVVHPVNGIDVTFTASAGKTHERTTSGMHLTYMAADMLKKNFVLRGEINKLREIIEVELVSPLKSMSVRVEGESGNPYHLKLNNIYDNRKHVTTELIWDVKKKYFELITQYYPDYVTQTVNIKGRYVNSTLIELEIFRQSTKGRLSEVNAALRLNTSNILHARLIWRPMVMADIQQLISDKMEIYSYNLNQVYGVVSRAIGNEMRTKYGVVVRELSQELQFISYFISSELKSMEWQLNTLKIELRRFYERNDLHIRDMGETINRWFEEVQTSYREFVEEFHIFYKELDDTIGEMKSGLRRYPFMEDFNQFTGRVAGIVKKLQRMVVDSINDLMYRFDEHSAALYAKYRAMNRHLSRMVRETMDMINENIHVKLLQGKYFEMKNKLKYFQHINIERLDEVFDDTIQSSLSPDMVETYKSVMLNMKSVLKAQVQDLMELKELNQLYNISKDVYEQTVWAYKYWNFEDKLRNVMAEAFDLGKEIMFHDLNRLKDNLSNFKKSRFIIIDTRRGELQFEIYLPVPLNSLAERPLNGIKKFVRNIQRAVTKYLPPRNTTFWDIYYRCRSRSVQSILPPFRSYASVIGNQHFITFDKKHFDFAGKCSYILTRDMVDDNFTVILNYDKKSMQKSFMVLFKGLTIEVSSNNQVTANDKKVELPFVSETVTVLHRLSLIEIDNGFGLKIDWDRKHEIFTISLPGWYFAKTAGLMGTYDNEDFNDLMTTQRILTDDIPTFAASWEIGRRRCLTKNFAQRAETTEVSTCSRLFVDTKSPFKRCFAQVDPAHFNMLCRQYVHGKEPQLGSCRAARQYISECKNLEVHLYLPSECVTCEGPGGVFNQYTEMELSADANDTTKRVTMSADIVFIVEEKQCNSEPIKVLPRLVSDLEQKLRLNGLRNNRYGLIGYGGEKPLDEEHVNTMDNFPFGESKGFLKGTENLRLSNSSKQADNLAAIRMAIGYPYRMGVAKIIVLMPCSGCSFDLKHLDLNDVIRSQGFSLHIIRDHQFQLPEETLKGDHIYGIDAKQAYSSKEEQNTNILNRLDKPNDICSRLALQSSGSVFDIKLMVSRRTRIQKHFMKELIHRIGKTSTPPKCQKCECKADGYAYVRAVCKPCVHRFSLWNYIPRWWPESESDERQAFNPQLQELEEFEKTTTSVNVKSL